MRVGKWAIVVGLVARLVVPARAQSGGGTAHWTMLEPPSSAGAFQYFLSNSAVPGSVTQPVQIAPSCATLNTGSQCTGPVPAALAIRGTFTLCATDGFTNSCSTPFAPGTVSNPSGFFVTRP